MSNFIVKLGWAVVLCWLLFCIVHLPLPCLSIQLQPIRVPSIVTEGSSVYLHCPFQLDGFLLQSVNWRKNGQLFFQYRPADRLSPQPTKQSQPVSGVRLDLDRSNASHVFLDRLDLNSQGRYACELVSSQPFHKQVSSEDQLTVVHLDYLLTPLLITGPRNSTSQRMSFTRNVATNASSDASIPNAGRLSNPSSSHLLNPSTTTTLQRFNSTSVPAFTSTLLATPSRSTSSVSRSLNSSSSYLATYRQRLTFPSSPTTSTTVSPVTSGSLIQRNVFKSTNRVDLGQLSAELDQARWSPTKISNQSTSFPLQQDQPRPAYKLDSLLTLSKTIETSKGKSPSPGSSSPSARLEVEEDNEDKEPLDRPAITSLMKPGWMPPVITAQVLPLRPQQFHDVRFLLRNDVFLFQPFSTDANNRPVASAAFVTQTDSILVVTFVALLLTIQSMQKKCE